MVGKLEEALRVANEAIAFAGDDENRAAALTLRGLGHALLGRHERAVRDSEEATRIARALGPARLSATMFFEAQARLFAGDHEAAAELLSEAERIGAPADASWLWPAAYRLRRCGQARRLNTTHDHSSWRSSTLMRCKSSTI